MGDPLVELIRRLHATAEHGSPELNSAEASSLLEDCRFDSELRSKIMDEFYLHANPTRRTMHRDDFIKSVSDVESRFGKEYIRTPISSIHEEFEGKPNQREVEPIRANPDLFAGIRGSLSKMPTAEDPWQRTMSKLSLREGDSERIDVDCAMVSVHELEGTLFKHVKYKIEISYGTAYGGGTESFVNSVAIRRYSDFAWLHGYLTSKYIFRAVPPIPPKEIATPTEAAELELARRRLPGLQAFIVACLVHPVFAKDAAFRAFLTVHETFGEWRRSSAEADISEEYVPRRFQELTEEQMSEPPASTDASFFDDSLKGFDQLCEYIERTIGSIVAMAQGYLNVSDETARLAESVNQADKMLPGSKAELDKAFQNLLASTRSTSAIGEAILGKTVRRLRILLALATGIYECVNRLSANIFADFASLSKQLVSIQGELEKVRLRDGPSIQSPDQMNLVASLKRAQRLYIHHHYRNEWAMATAKQEVEMFMQKHLCELKYSLQDLSLLLAKQ